MAANKTTDDCWAMIPGFGHPPALLGRRVVVAQPGLANGKDSKEEKPVGKGGYTGYFTRQNTRAEVRLKRAAR